MVGISYRPGGVGDLEELATTSVVGYETCRDFRPPGWAPPDVDGERGWLGGQLGIPGAWCEIAAVGDSVAGHFIAMPAAVSRVPVSDPALAHLLHLFVRPAHWGSGVASGLHDRGMDEARGRSFTSMRLFTPEGNARARRFYEREGWSAPGDPRPEPEFGMDIIEYRRSL